MRNNLFYHTFQKPDSIGTESSEGRASRQWHRIGARHRDRARRTQGFAKKKTGRERFVGFRVLGMLRSSNRSYGRASVHEGRSMPGTARMKSSLGTAIGYATHGERQRELVPLKCQIKFWVT